MHLVQYKMQLQLNVDNLESGIMDLVTGNQCVVSYRLITTTMTLRERELYTLLLSKLSAYPRILVTKPCEHRIMHGEATKRLGVM